MSQGANATLEELLAGGTVLADGAWGTQMQQRGLAPGDCPEAWNLDCADRVEDVAKAYVEAGCQVIITNTFGANRFVLDRHSLGDKTSEINRAGVEISRRAAGQQARVFASLGPSGKMLFMQEVSADELAAAFAVQSEALAAGGADGIVVETMTDPEEAKIAIAAAKATGLPVVGCMTFDTGPNQDRTMTGATPEQAAEAIIGAGADVVGSNCGQGIAAMAGICRRLRAVTELPIWIKPNAGLPEMVDGQTVYKQTPTDFASFAPDLVEAGANFIGGCCGTTPEFIQALGERLR